MIWVERQYLFSETFQISMLPGIFAIEAALTIRMILHLPLRQTEGFLRSLAEKLELNIPIPDHTTL